MSNRAQDMEAIVVRLSQLDLTSEDYTTPLEELIADAQRELQRDRGRRGMTAARTAALASRRAKSAELIADMLTHIARARADGAINEDQIARWLNEHEIKPPEAESWTRHTVYRVLKVAKKSQGEQIPA